MREITRNFYIKDIKYRDGLLLYEKVLLEKRENIIDTLIHFLTEVRRAGGFRASEKKVRVALHISEDELLEKYTVKRQTFLLSDGSVDYRVSGVSELPPRESATFGHDDDIFYILMQHGYALDDKGYWIKKQGARL